jgi:hypothetical protein
MAGPVRGTRGNDRALSIRGGPQWRGNIATLGAASSGFLSAKTPQAGAGGDGMADSTSAVMASEVETDQDDMTRKEVECERKADAKIAEDFVASLEEEVRNAAKEILSDSDAEILDARAEAERRIAEARKKDNDRVIDRNTVYAGLLVEQVVFCRQAGRDSCSRHGWTRQVEPSKVRENDAYDVCDKCTVHCGATLEQTCIYAAGLVELGTWNAEQKSQVMEKIRRGVCCGRI